MKAKKALKKKKPIRSDKVVYWTEGAVQAAPGRPARQALQQRPAALAAAGLSAQGLAGGRQGPQCAAQTPDGRGPRARQREQPRSDAADAGRARLRRRSIRHRRRSIRASKGKLPERLRGHPCHAHRKARSPARFSQHPSAVRGLSPRPPRDRRPQRAHPGAGERAGNAPAAAAPCPRALARQAAAGPAGY